MIGLLFSAICSKKLSHCLQCQAMWWREQYGTKKTLCIQSHLHRLTLENIKWMVFIPPTHTTMQCHEGIQRYVQCMWRQFVYIYFVPFFIVDTLLFRVTKAIELVRSNFTWICHLIWSCMCSRLFQIHIFPIESIMNCMWCVWYVFFFVFCRFFKYHIRYPNKFHSKNDKMRKCEENLRFSVIWIISRCVCNSDFGFVFKCYSPFFPILPTFGSGTFEICKKITNISDFMCNRTTKWTTYVWICNHSRG